MSIYHKKHCPICETNLINHQYKKHKYSLNSSSCPNKCYSYDKIKFPYELIVKIYIFKESYILSRHVLKTNKIYKDKLKEQQTKEMIDYWKKDEKYLMEFLTNKKQN